MHRKRVGFDEIEIPIPKGHEKIVDRDETTEYLFINGPKRIYTVYFDSAMPFYSGKVLSCYPEGSTLELKLPDRKIVFFCPSRGEARKDGLWYFNIEFDETGSIGKRYRRQDEIGTPFCITYDFDSENDGCVTVRERDSMEQVRMPISDLKDYIFSKMDF